MNKVTASFEEKIPYPSSEAGQRFLEHFTDGEGVYYTHYLAYMLSRAHFAAHVLRTVGKELGITQNYLTTMYQKMDYSSYELWEADKPQEMAGRISVSTSPAKDMLGYPGTFIPGDWNQITSLGLQSASNMPQFEGIPSYSATKFARQWTLLKLFGEDLTNKIHIPLDADLAKRLYTMPLGSDKIIMSEDVTEEEYAEYLDMFDGFTISLDVPNGIMDKVREKQKDAPTAYEKLDALFQALSGEGDILVAANMIVPKDVFPYVSQNKKVRLPNVYQFFQKLYALQAGAPGAEYPAPIKDLSIVVEDIKNLRSIPKVNKDGVIVRYNGQVLWVPDIDNLDAHYKQYDQDVMALITKNEQDGTLTYMPTKGSIPKNRYLYTDWRLDKAVYVNTTGSINLIDLNGAAPLNASGMINQMGIRIDTEDGKPIQAALTVLSQAAKALDLDIQSYMEPEDWLPVVPGGNRNDFMSSTPSYKEIFSSLNVLGRSGSLWKSPKDATLLEIIGKVHSVYISAMNNESTYGTDTDYAQVEAPSSIRIIYEMSPLNFIHRLAADVEKKLKGDYLQLLSNDTSVSRIMTSVPYIKIFANLEDLQEVYDLDTKEREQYATVITDGDYKPTPVPNLKDDMSFLPHQVKVDAQLDKDPDNDVVHVEPGGGKTLLTIISALRAMAAGNRVLVISPNYLIPNYIEDTLFATNGKANVFPINNGIYSRYGEDTLRQMIMDAPPNTLFIAGLSLFSRGANVDYSYCGKTLNINQIVEFIRDIEWDYVFIDESHKLANPDSTRTYNSARLVSGIPKKRELTGTFINGTMLDAYGQSKILNPGIFGSQDSFTSTYGEQFKGSKVVKWKPNAENQIRDHMRQHTGYIYVPQKEWAYLLPYKKERFHNCQLNDAQRKVYEAILTEVLEDVRKDAELMGHLKDGDEATTDQLEFFLKRYLARVERFLASCDLDELGQRLLKGKDLVSPKSDVVNKILAEHFSNDETKDGKVLIFTSYLDSAESIYNNMDPRFKDMTIHYIASKKDELIPLMKKDKTKRITVGSEESLNTGHNFQQYSRIIRIETIWNPGTLVQAESRIFRPNVKEKENRSSIYLDWVLVDRTIDVTKTARLISKMISAAKFNAQGDPRFAKVPDLPLVGMTFENILVQNDFDDNLSHYLDAYREYKNIEKDEFELYREKNKDAKMVAVPSAGVMAKSALIQVPYISGMVLPYQDDLGLENLSATALRMHVSIVNLGDQIKGKKVHTEYGDGVVKRASASTVAVKLDSDGSTVSVDKGACFLKTKDIGDTWAAIEQIVGLGSTQKSKKNTQQALEVEQTKEAKRGNRKKEPVPNTDLEQNASVELTVMTMNNFISVALDSEDPDVTDRLADKMKLTYSGEYYYAWIRSAKHMQNALAELEKVFEIPNSCKKKLQQVLEAFNGGKSKILNIEQASQIEVKNFYLLRRKQRGPKELYVYPVVEDGDLYLIAFADKQPASKKLPQVRVPGVRWEHTEGFYGAFFTKKSDVKAWIKSFQKESGVTISNMDEVKESFSAIRLTAPSAK